MVLEEGLWLISGSHEGVISLRRRVVRQRYNEKRPKPRVSPWSDHSPCLAQPTADHEHLDTTSPKTPENSTAALPWDTRLGRAWSD